MYLKSDVNFAYDEQSGITTCTLTDTKNRTYVGTARCHPEDKDMQNRLTGQEIAYRRAYLTYLKYLRDINLPKLEVLRHTYSCMEQAFDFDPKDNNARLMRRAISDYAAGVDMLREAIKDERNALHTYMVDKAAMYKSIRDWRKTKAGDKNNQENS